VFFFGAAFAAVGALAALALIPAIVKRDRDAPADLIR
jgi:hypothetical protein